jgi:predicted GNAT family acetyltransferase
MILLVNRVRKKCLKNKINAHTRGANSKQTTPSVININGINTTPKKRRRGLLSAIFLEDALHQ